MTHGELTPYMHARVDTEFYQAGLALARNCLVLRYGGVTRIPGTLYQGPVKTAAKKTYLIPFEFSRSQVYAIEAGDLYFRFWTANGQIESLGTPVEVVTPYLEADLPYLYVRQSGDVLYIWCRKAAGGAYQPRTLTRNSETSWTLATYAPSEGPFLDVNESATLLTPAAYGSVVPKMTNNTTPAGVAANIDADADAWEVFDRDEGTRSDIGTGTLPAWISYTFPGGTTLTANKYYVQLTSEADAGAAPIAFKFQGFDGANWVTLDTRLSESGWVSGETRFYEFPNEVAYAAYRLLMSASQDPSASNFKIAELGINQKLSEQAAFNLTASSVAGLNEGQGFLASDVGRVIGLKASDGVWRTAVIQSRTNSTLVTIKIDGHALPDLDPIAQWKFGAFSDETGWPKAGAIYEDRLVHANTDNDPLGVWMSVIGDYDNFRVSSPLVDDDSISIRLTGGKLNDIGWLIENRDLVGGTAGSLRAIGRSNNNAALSPSNIRQRAETLTASSTAQPISIENVLLFLDVFEMRMYEAAYTYEVEGYLAREASTLNEHLYGPGVRKLVYLSQPHKTIVGLRHDGKLIMTTYDREQKVNGATLVDFGGEVEDILDLPGETGTDLWLTVKRTVDGNTVRYVERLAEFWREDTTVQELPLYAACGLLYQGASTPTLTGLDHLEGETVGVWADGRDIGDAVVAAGQITLPNDVEATEVAVGLRMNFQVKTLRLSQIGNRDGSGLGRQAKIINAHLDFYESAGMSVGSMKVTDEMQFEAAAEDDPDEPVPLRTGMFQAPIDDSWNERGVFVIESDRMYPITLRGISLEVEGEP